VQRVLGDLAVACATSQQCIGNATMAEGAATDVTEGLLANLMRLRELPLSGGDYNITIFRCCPGAGGWRPGTSFQFAICKRGFFPPYLPMSYFGSIKVG
jgi:hypothetical protein